MENSAVDSQEESTRKELPVRAVTLFSSGVAYTLRQSEIEGGDVRVALTFRTTQINDLLKSLVLLDSAGIVQPVIYPSRDPIGRTLQSFAVNVSGNPSLGELLQQIRGSSVAFETTGQEQITGRIVAIEGREEVDANQHAITTSYLTVLTNTGLMSLPLSRIHRLRLEDAALDKDFHEALALLATSHDEERRIIILHFVGTERRMVQAGYVTEAPLWKISYRLVLEDNPNVPDAKNPKAYLQGWAIVENTSDEDWNDIALSLVSGRPVSFIQDLYQPLYLARPVVPNDVVASPFPQAHQGNMGFSVRESLSYAPNMPMAAAVPAPVAMRSFSSAQNASDSPRGISSAEMAASVPSQAEGGSVGELFRYDITTPVSLPKQQAAMIPVLADSVEAEKLSLFNADRDGRFPLNAVRLRNTTALHLKGGSVTIFDGGIYAGDARVEELPPADSRLLTYAVDLAMPCEQQRAGWAVYTLTLTIRRGVLNIRRQYRQETKYLLQNKAQKQRRVLVEHPFRADSTLIAPVEPTERTPEWYRFLVEVAPGSTETLAVTVAMHRDETVALNDSNTDTLSQYVMASNSTVPNRIKAVLSDIVERRQRTQEPLAQAENQEAEIERITTEQERIRANMAAVDNQSALYRRYLDQLDAQETRIQILRQEAENLRQEAQTAETELRLYLDTLNLE